MNPAKNPARGKPRRRQNAYIRARRDVRGIILFPRCVNNASELEEELDEVSEEERMIAGIRYEIEQSGGRADEGCALERGYKL